MIQISELFYTYPGNHRPTIKGVNLSVKKGEIFGFLGPSGTGKSTLQKVLIGVLKNYQGKVRVLGQEAEQATGSFYEKLGVAFETPNFYQRFTAEENLQFFSSFYTKIAKDDFLRKVGLENDKHTKVADFSKGMLMRLNLVRSFLHDPDLILLDEPTAGLDPVNVNKVKELIMDKRAEGKTILLNTHNMHVAESMCDRVAFIVDGEIKLIDSPARLINLHSDKKVVVTFFENGEWRESSFSLSGLYKNEDFQSLLKQGKCESIQTYEKTLEDIFIEVTGRKLQ
ncbi:ABC transporter ATP-binding protein [Alteribacter populi]|uniref:ABC transporter ATP-binding protein n=1 Tax=Alteribacter populi TaxID=2011011 RepID=UPI000BBAD66D|nr:ABC transporter ATP-binding protein [Alteribacter populi]